MRKSVFNNTNLDVMLAKETRTKTGHEYHRRKVYEHYSTMEVVPNFVNDKRNYYREEYLKSPHWSELRNKKMQESRCCEICGSNHRLDVHHLNYRNLFDVVIEDLQVLCRRCHASIHRHEKPKVKENLVQVNALIPRELERQKRVYIPSFYRRKNGKGRPLNIL